MSKWSCFLKNESKCRMCRREDRINRFKKEVKKENYKFVDFVTEERAVLQCEKFHDKYEVDMSKFFDGGRCPQCAIQKRADNKRHTIDFIKNHIEFESGTGYKLLNSDYQSNLSKLKIECDKGHIYTTNFINFYNNKSRCPYCAGVVKYTYEYVKWYIESFGHELISKKYENNRSGIMVRCERGHESETTFGSFLKGHRCRLCSYEDVRGEYHHNWKGGVTTLNKFLRELLHDWKEDSLKATNYTCDITGKNGYLEVHHKYPFHSMVSEVLIDLNITNKESVGDYS
ncbi:hypothetical protein [Bacillus sp. FJAT-50079]|uniref:hypothetical protein n=1 Tax=Bacillus sp. FJAT-50079 TaxID=2833577 RepID=UPI001BC91482|nr:hypothetical protein [Bacillus sp. FJAT-50079]MBS4207505.1 hypothetical protein [Bacillus sp. FJAT-50079]